MQCEALVDKLQHPLEKIRTRAVQNLKFKVQSGILSVQAVSTPHCLKNLLHCVQPESSLDALQFLLYLVKESKECREVLNELGAISFLKMVQVDEMSNNVMEQVVEYLLIGKTNGNGIKKVNTNFESDVVEQPQRSPPPESEMGKVVNDELMVALVTEGWHFPMVVLTEPDEKYLYEFEVKCRRQEEPEMIIQYCAYFSETILQDFPPEVFLQRTNVIEMLLNLLKVPIENTLEEQGMSDSMYNTMEEVKKLPFGECYYGYENQNTALCVYMAVLNTLELYMDKLFKAFQLHLDSSYYMKKSMVEVVAAQHAKYYPGQLDTQEKSISMDEDNLAPWSLSGTVYAVMMDILPLMYTTYYPQLQLATFLKSMMQYLLDASNEESCGNSVSLDLDVCRINEILKLLDSIAEVKPYNIFNEESFATVEALPDLATGHLLDMIITLVTAYPANHYTLIGQDTNNDHLIRIPQTIYEVLLAVFRNEYLYQTKPCWREKLSDILEVLNPGMQEECTNTKTILQEAKSAAALHQQVQDWQLDVNSEQLLEKMSLLSQEQIQTLQTMALDVVQFCSYYQGTCDDLLRDVFNVYCITCSNPSHSGLENSKKLFHLLLLEKHAIDVIWPMIGQALEKEPLQTSQMFYVLTHEETILNRIVADLFSTSSLRTILFHFSNLNTISNEQWDFGYQVFTRLDEYLQCLDIDGEDLVLRNVSEVVPHLQHVAYVMDDTNARSSRCRSVIRHVLQLLDRKLDSCHRWLGMMRCSLHRNKSIRISAVKGMRRFLPEVEATDINELDSSLALLDPMGSRESSIVETIKALHTNSKDKKGSRALSMLHDIIENLVNMVGDPSFDQEVVQAAIKQLVHIFSTNANVTESKWFHDWCKKLLLKLLTELSNPTSKNITPFLQLLSTITCKSFVIRETIRSNETTLALIAKFIFAADNVHLSLAYCIIVNLTLLNELWFPATECIACEIPPNLQALGFLTQSDTFTVGCTIWEIIIDTFSSTKSSSGTWPSKQQLAMKSSPGLVGRVEAILGQKDARVGSGDQILNNLEKFYSVDFLCENMYSSLSSARSHRTFLNTLYYFSRTVRSLSNADKEVVANSPWTTKFRRFLSNYPTSAQDETVMTAIIDFLSLVSKWMCKEIGLSIVVFAKDTLIPVLSNMDETDNQVFKSGRKVRKSIMQLLCSCSEQQNMIEFYHALSMDTKLVDTICRLYATVHIRDTKMQLSSLQLITQCFQGGVIEAHHIKELAPALVTLIDSFRILDSFRDKALLHGAVRALFMLTSKLNKKDETFYCKTFVKGMENGFIWCSRLTLDRDARIRAITLGVLCNMLNFFVSVSPEFKKYGASYRSILSLGTRVIRDPCECDAVKATGINIVACVLRLPSTKRGAEIFEELLLDMDKEQLSQLLLKQINSVEEASIRLKLSILYFIPLFLETPNFLKCRVLEILDTSDGRTMLWKAIDPSYHKFQMMERSVQSLRVASNRPPLLHSNFDSISLLLEQTSHCEQLIPAVGVAAMRVIQWLLEARDACCADFLQNTLIFATLLNILELTSNTEHLSKDNLFHSMAIKLLNNFCVLRLEYKISDAEFVPPQRSAAGNHIDLYNVFVTCTAVNTPLACKTSTFSLISAVTSDSTMNHCLQNESASLTLVEQLCDYYVEMHEELKASKSDISLDVEFENLWHCSKALANLLYGRTTLVNKFENLGITSFCMKNIRQHHGAIRKSNMSKDLASSIKFRMECIKSHLRVLSSALFGAQKSRNKKMHMEVLSMIAQLWPLAEHYLYLTSTSTSFSCSKPLSFCLLKSTINLIYENVNLKRQMTVAGGSGSTGSQSMLQCLMIYLVRVTLLDMKSKEYCKREHHDTETIILAYRVLRSAVSQPECALEVVKSSFIERTLDSLGTLYSAKEINSVVLLEIVVFLAGASQITATAECVLRHSHLQNILMDLVMKCGNQIRDATVYWIRNLSYSKIGKNSLLSFTKLLATLANILPKVCLATQRHIITCFWCMAYNNQRGLVALANLNIPSRLEDLPDLTTTEEGAETIKAMTQLSLLLSN